MRIKRFKRCIAAVLVLAGLCTFTACSGRDGGISKGTDSNEQQEREDHAGSRESESDISDAADMKDNLTFPVGQAISGGSFTGTAYLAPMIANEDIYHFPQTNHVTFESGARSGWHSHGGMIMQSENFSGAAYVSSLIGADNAADAPELHYVVFDPGVINNWHIHEGGQILIATDGIGYHQIEGEPVEVMYLGDVVYCPPGVKHWHGGSADTEFAHIAVNTNPEHSRVEWFERISEEEYDSFEIH